MGSYISTSQIYEHFVNKQAFLRISRNYFSEPRQPRPIVGTRSSASGLLMHGSYYIYDKPTLLLWRLAKVSISPNEGSTSETFL